MSYQGSEEALIHNWINTTLKAYTDLTDIVGQNIFEDLAPDGTPFPYIIHQTQSPPRVVRGTGPVEVMVDGTFTVKAVNQSLSRESLADAVSAVRAALVTSELQTPTGGLVFVCLYERQVSYVEGKGAEQTRHLGGEYRIQARAS